MSQIFIKLSAFILISAFFIPCFAQNKDYFWLPDSSEYNSLADRIKPPQDYKRVEVADSSFEKWLRYLPLKPGRPPVYLYDGRPKYNQKAQFAVFNIDIGNRDLQQCADAVIRLRAEYLYSIKAYDKIDFDFTSGDKASFRNWINGLRPIINGNNVTWKKLAAIDSSYSSFRKYLTTIFIYAGSYSLNREMTKVNNIADIKAGDIFIQGNFPGHAVIVLDVAVHQTNGNKIFLLAQSYMPAQDIHLLVNPNDSSFNPWYITDFGEILITPEWSFNKGDLKRFK